MLWVQFDAGSGFGNPAGIAFSLDRAGPVVQPVVVDPAYSNGDGDPIQISATADSTLTGTGTVQAGVASLTSCPAPTTPTGYSLTANTPGAPIVDLAGSIAAGDVGALGDGTHTVYVTAQDNRGVWSNNGGGSGLCGEGTIVVDHVAPSITAATLDPAGPNDGTMAYNGNQTYLAVVRLTAHVSEPAALDGTSSGIAQVEGFIDENNPLLVPPIDLPADAVNGEGFLFAATDGVFDEAEEDVYADLPLAALASFAIGDHEIWIHAMDRAGNWEDLTGEPADAVFTLTAGAPVVTSLTLNTANNQLTAVAASPTPGVTVAALQYWAQPTLPKPGIDAGTAVTITPAASVTATFAALPAAGGNVWVAARDSNGVWSLPVGLPVAGGVTFSTHLTGPSRYRTISGTLTASVPEGVIAAEYRNGTTPAAAGAGTAITISATDVSSLSIPFEVTRPAASSFATGSTVWVRVRDGRGNWGPATAFVVPA